jgi:hypothetical protein
MQWLGDNRTMVDDDGLWSMRLHLQDSMPISTQQQQHNSQHRMNGSSSSPEQQQQPQTQQQSLPQALQNLQRLLQTQLANVNPIHLQQALQRQQVID